ncbi:MAG: hypothetical protein ACRD0A_00370 [Acidimicrobiales bacterium]
MSLATATPSLTPSLTVRPWPDSVIDQLGHDPRSAYVERFWLPVLGPSACWLLRRLASWLERDPDGFELPVDETALSLGLGVRPGRQAPLRRTIERCCQFRVTHLDGEAATLLVRRKLPPLTRNQVTRLPDSLQAAHRAFLEHQLRQPTDTGLRLRAQRLALTLYELGEDRAAAEQQLLRWRFHPALASECVAWAYDRAGRRAAATSEPGPPEPPDPPVAA